MLHRRRAPLFAGLGLVLALGSARASVVTYMDTAKMVRLSPVIVRGNVEAVAALEDGPDRIFTAISLRVIESYRGAEGLERIVLRQLGGRVGDRESRVYGTPSFHPGEDVVVFARPAKAGWLTVTGLFQGKVEIVRRQGRAFAVRSGPRSPGGVLVRGGDAPEEPVQPLATWIERLRRHVRDHPAIDRWHPPETPLALTGDPPAFTTLLVPLRRFEPDSDLPIVYRYNPLGAPAAPGGARHAFLAAIRAWNEVSGSRARLADGGDTSAQCYLTFDGVSAIMHQDPCGEMPEFDGATCSGVLAIGGLSELNPFEIKNVNGQLFLRGLQGDVVTNAGADCFYNQPKNYEEVITHELGHTVGLGHSCGDAWSPECSTSPLLDEAQMRAFAHGDGRGASPRRDDVLGIRFIYPPEAFVELHANADAGGVGDPWSVSLDLNGTAVADLWLVVVLPNGEVSGGPVAASVSLRFYSDVLLFSYSFDGSEPAGSYHAVALLVPPGRTPASAADILSYSVASFAFDPE